MPFIAAGSALLAVDLDAPARSILSEGATGTFFSTDVALLNPAATPVPVTIHYFREGEPEIQDTRTLPARSRTTIHLDDVPGSARPRSRPRWTRRPTRRLSPSD